MKIKRIGIILFVTVIMFLTCFTTGCVFSDVGTLSDIKYLDFEKSDINASSIYKSGAISFSGKYVNVSLELSENPYFTLTQYISDYEYEEVFKLTEEKSISGAYQLQNLSYDNSSHADISGELKAVGNDNRNIKVKDGVIYLSTSVYGQSIGSTNQTLINIVFTEKGSDRQQRDININETDTFANIKRSYVEAGYETDWDKNNTSESVRNAIHKAKADHSVFGRELCFIGKDIDDDCQLYMLINTYIEKQAMDIEKAYESNALRYNNYVIVSLFPNANFDPFKKAIESKDNNDKPDIDTPPDDNDDPDHNTNFSKIVQSYSKSGYNTNLEGSVDDKNLRATIEQLKALYATMGWEICFIGKNLNDIANIELYMLISTDTEAQALEIEQTYTSSANKVLRNKKDVIVSIMGSYNFQPFTDAIT